MELSVKGKKFEYLRKEIVIEITKIKNNVLKKGIDGNLNGLSPKKAHLVKRERKRERKRIRTTGTLLRWKK